MIFWKPYTREQKILSVMQDDEWFINYLTDKQMNEWLAKLEKEKYEGDLFKELDGYYKEHPDIFHKVKNIVVNKKNGTFRNIVYGIEGAPDLVKQYEDMKKKYTVLYFHLFSRGAPTIEYDGLNVALGQLNFFRWIFVDEIINF